MTSLFSAPNVGLLVKLPQIHAVLVVLLLASLSYMLAAARQPNMSAKLLPYCILGFALSEALALFTLLIALLELFVFS